MPKLLYKPHVQRNECGVWLVYIYTPYGVQVVPRLNWADAFSVALGNAKLQVRGYYY